MLAARRYRRAADELTARLAAEQRLSLPVGAAAAAPRARAAGGARRPSTTRRGWRGARRPAAAPAAASTWATCTSPRVSVAARLEHLRGLLRRGVVRLRGGGPGRRSRDRGHDAVRAARAVQAGRGVLGPGRAVRRDPGERAHGRRAGAAEGRGMRELGSQCSRRCCSSPPTRCPCPSWPTPRRPPRARSSSRWPACARTTREGWRGIVLREVAGGFTLASDPVAEPAARRLLARPRTPPLTPAQAETLAIVAYLQPVSRPEIARIRGVASDSATASLHRSRADRGVRPLPVRGGALPHDASCS